MYSIISKEQKKKLADHIVQLEQEIAEAKSFIEEIGKGNLSVSLSEGQGESNLDSALTHSLLNMRDKMKQVADTEQKRNWINEGLSTFGEMMRMGSDDFQGMADTILAKLTKYIGAVQGWLYIVEEQDKVPYLNLLSCYAYDRKKYLKKRIEIGEGLCGQVFYEKEKTMLVEIPEDYLEVNSGSTIGKPASVLVMPLKLDDQVQGVLELVSLKVFEQYEVDFIEKLSEGLAATISSLQVNKKTKELLEASQQQSVMLREQEEELRQNMEEMQATQEEMKRIQAELNGQMSAIDRAIPKLELNLAGKISFVNDAFLEMTGYQKEELVGKPHAFLIDSKGQQSPEYATLQEALKNGQPFQCSCERRGADKSFQVKEIFHPVYDMEGRLLKTLVIFFDLTKEKEQEAKIKEMLSEVQRTNEELLTQEEELRQNLEEMQAIQENIEQERQKTKGILDGCLDAVISINTMGQVEYFNPAAEKLWGYGADEVVGKTMGFLAPSGLREEHDAGFERYLRTGQKKVIGVGREVKILTKDQREIDVLLTLSEIRTSNDHFFTAFIKDITQEKKHREAAELERLKSKAILDGCIDAVVTINSRGIIEYFNPAAEKLWRYSQEEVLGKNMEFLAPKSMREAHNRGMSDYLRTGNKKVIGMGREVKILTKDGREVDAFLSLSESTVRSDIFFTAFFKDITEEKRTRVDAEAERIKNKAILDGCIDAVVTINEKGVVEYFNPAAEKLWGYTSAEMVGNRMDILGPVQGIREHNKGMKRYLETGEKRVIGKGRKVHIQTKAGEKKEILLTLAEARIKDQLVFTAFIKDLTDDKYGIG